MQKIILIILMLNLLVSCCKPLEKQNKKLLTEQEKSFFIFDNADSVDVLNLKTDIKIRGNVKSGCGSVAVKDVLSGCSHYEPESCFMLSPNGEGKDLIPYEYYFEISANKFLNLDFKYADKSFQKEKIFHFSDMEFNSNQIPNVGDLNIGGTSYKNLYKIVGKGDSVALYISPEDKIMYYKNTIKNQEFLFKPIIK